MKSHHEVENTYNPTEDDQVPDLTILDEVAEVRREPDIALSAIYFDTPGLDLTSAGVSLRRRTGGADEGWHLKVPTGSGDRLELRRPLGRSETLPPKQLRDLAAGWIRSGVLAPVARIDTLRSPLLLLDGQAQVLAEFVDDRVSGSTPEGAVVQWREWELELVDGGTDLLTRADQVLAEAGVLRAEVDRKIVRVLGPSLPAPVQRRAPRVGKPMSRLVHDRLAVLVGGLARHDVGARLGTDHDIHQMRVACRELRALLATFRPVLDGPRTEPIRTEIQWIAGVLGEARDAAVVHQHLCRLLDAEPQALVQGPVRRRLRATYPGRGKPQVRAALLSPRYLELRDSLDALVLDPPFSPLAESTVRDVAPRLLRKELKRFDARVRAAAESEHPTEALHAARKAAKRLRYAADTLKPVAGKPVRRLAEEAKQVTSCLGDLQDTVVSRAEVLELAGQAAGAGEASFTYGLLHARLEVRGEQLTASFWASDAVATLDSHCRHAIRALTGTRT